MNIKKIMFYIALVGISTLSISELQAKHGKDWQNDGQEEQGEKEGGWRSWFGGRGKKGGHRLIREIMNNVQEKIDDAKEDATEGIWKIIGFLQKIMKYAKLICSALHMINKIKNLLDAIGTSLTMAHLTSQGTVLEGVLGPLKSTACEADDQAGQLAQKSYGFGGSKAGFLDKFCKWVNCQMSPQESTDPKIDPGSGGWGEIGDSIFKGHWFTDYFDQAQTGSWNTLYTDKILGNEGSGATGTFEEVYGIRYHQYANARDNLLVAIVVGCIPGIINGLEKYRQILCLYADCLEQNAYIDQSTQINMDPMSGIRLDTMLEQLLFAVSGAFVELGWTPTVHDQAEDRCHRIGQKGSVNAWYLMADNTIDNYMWDLIESKRQIVGLSTEGIQGIGKDDIVTGLIRKLLCEG